MELDPAKRITAAEALHHQFFVLPSRCDHQDKSLVDRNRNVEENWKEDICQIEYGNDCAVCPEDISSRRTPQSTRTMLGNISRAAPAASIISPSNIRHINTPNSVPSKQYCRLHTDKDDNCVKGCCFHGQGTTRRVTGNFTRVGCDSLGTIGNKRKHEQLHTSCANLGAGVATNAASSTLFESNEPCASETYCSRTTESFPPRHRYPVVSHLQRLEARQAVLRPRPDYMDMQLDLVWYSRGVAWCGIA